MPNKQAAPVEIMKEGDYQLLHFPMAYDLNGKFHSNYEVHLNGKNVLGISTRDEQSAIRSFHNTRRTY